MKHLLVVVCAYEIEALTSGRWPSITSLAARHPLLAAALVLALAAHFLLEIVRHAREATL